MCKTCPTVKVKCGSVQRVYHLDTCPVKVKRIK